MASAELASPTSDISKIVYLGTPEIAVKPLQELVRAGFEVPLVITRKDARRGRGKQTSPNPVKLAAQDLGIKVSHDLEDITTVEADIGVVVAYGRIIPVDILRQIALVNLHFSLLPKWRGAAPLERALIEGDVETGVCLMAIEEGLDTGGVYEVANLVIKSDWNLADLAASCVEVGSDMLVKNLKAGLGEPKAQVGEPTYASMLTSDEFEITPDSSALEVVRKLKVRPCWMMVEGKRVKVWAATVSDQGEDLESGQLLGELLGLSGGTLLLEQVQPEGKKPMSADVWTQGRQNKSGYLDLVGR